MGHPIVSAQPHARPQIDKDSVLQLNPAVRSDSPHTVDIERTKVSLMGHAFAHEQDRQHAAQAIALKRHGIHRLQDINRPACRLR